MKFGFTPPHPTTRLPTTQKIRKVPCSKSPTFPKKNHSPPSHPFPTSHGVFFHTCNPEFKIPSCKIELGTNLEPRLYTSIFQLRRWNFEVFFLSFFHLFPSSNCATQTSKYHHQASNFGSVAFAAPSLPLTLLPLILPRPLLLGGCLGEGPRTGGCSPPPPGNGQHSPCLGEGVARCQPGFSAEHRVQGSGFRVWGLGFGIQGFRFRVLGFRVLGLRV